MKRFEGVLDLLAKGHVFDGKLVVLDNAGRPLFKELLFGRRRPTYVAFDLLIADGIDLRPQPLKHRKAVLALARSARGGALDRPHQWYHRRRLYGAVVDADLEGIVAKHLADVYHPKLALLAEGHQSNLLAASGPRRMVPRAAAHRR